jgi:adenylylsulfate kinase
MTWVIWLTGYPGSGKTSIAQQFVDILALGTTECEWLRLDEFRKKIVPEPEYTERERDIVYNAVGVLAAFLAQHTVNVLVDATAHRKKWRDRARAQIENFYEVYVKCPLDICMERESHREDNLIVSEMYKKAIKRKKKLEKGEKVEKSEVGDVIGVDVPYEEPEDPELIIETDKVTPQEGARFLYELVIKN